MEKGKQKIRDITSKTRKIGGLSVCTSPKGPPHGAHTQEEKLTKHQTLEAFGRRGRVLRRVGFPFFYVSANIVHLGKKKRQVGSEAPGRELGSESTPRPRPKMHLVFCDGRRTSKHRTSGGGTTRQSIAGRGSAGATRKLLPQTAQTISLTRYLGPAVVGS